MDRGAWGLQSMGLQKVGHNWVTFTGTINGIYFLRKLTWCTLPAGRRKGPLRLPEGMRPPRSFAETRVLAPPTHLQMIGPGPGQSDSFPEIYYIELEGRALPLDLLNWDDVQNSLCHTNTHIKVYSEKKTEDTVWVLRSSWPWGQLHFCFSPSVSLYSLI